MSLIKSILAFFKPRQKFHVPFTRRIHDVYDPSQDPHRIMKGEIESYFE